MPNPNFGPFLGSPWLNPSVPESTAAEQESTEAEQESTAAEQERQECSRREHRNYRSTEKESIIITLMAANLTRIAFLRL